MTDAEKRAAYRAGYKAGCKGADQDFSDNPYWREGYADGLWGRDPRYPSLWPLRLLLVAVAVLAGAIVGSLL